MGGGDITVKGWVLRDTPSGMGVVFKPQGPRYACRYDNERVFLPKSQIAVVKGVMEDEVTMPLWLAEQKGLA